MYSVFKFSEPFAPHFPAPSTSHLARRVLKPQADQELFAAQYAEFYMRYLGHDSRAGEIAFDQEKATSAALQTKLVSITKDHGDTYVGGIRPPDPLKARHFDSTELDPTGSAAAISPAWPSTFCMRSQLLEPLSRAITGVGKGSIGIEIAKGLLSCGAHVVITTLSYNRIAIEYHQLIQTFGSRGSALTVVPFNQASKLGVEAFVDYIYANLGMDLNYIIPSPAAVDVLPCANFPFNISTLESSDSLSGPSHLHGLIDLEKVVVGFALEVGS
ncbi:hypothetical protein DXG01_016038 [Tephrocybe rancida]|nr:hypothetical protein DXG01_016038 [Tephrocybe rancida]